VLKHSREQPVVCGAGTSAGFLHRTVQVLLSLPAAATAGPQGAQPSVWPRGPSEGLHRQGQLGHTPSPLLGTHRKPQSNFGRRATIHPSPGASCCCQPRHRGFEPQNQGTDSVESRNPSERPENALDPSPVNIIIRP